MIDFIGKYTWEELCREWTRRAGAAGELPYLPDKVGSAWNAAAQVDVVGINSMQKTLILGECKWTATPNDRKSIADLIEEKARKIVPNRGKWKVFFLGFSRRMDSGCSCLSESDQPTTGCRLELDFDWHAFSGTRSIGSGPRAVDTINPLKHSPENALNWTNAFMRK